MSYGHCPNCNVEGHKLTTRERRPNGDTTCGACGLKSPSKEWAVATMAHSAHYPWARDLFLAMHTQASNFNAQLIRLVAKADGFNRRKLARGFPDAVHVFDAWEKSPTEGAFMERYQVQEGLHEPELSTFKSIFAPKHEPEPVLACQRCGTRPALEEHPCPYQQEIHEDHEILCNCCDECANECAADI